jgi:hypothetical protein
MSNIFIKDIIGISGSIYDVPEDDSEISSATGGLHRLLQQVSGLSYDRVLAWVEDSSELDGCRVLSGMIEKFYYRDKECPDTTEVNQMSADIKFILESDSQINSIGDQTVNIFQTGAYFWWKRSEKHNCLFPTVEEDSIVVGGQQENGRWFPDGSLVLGGNEIRSDERLRIVGGGIRIESEDKWRGDISFTPRTVDPMNPDEGDVWYNSSEGFLKYFDGSEVVVLMRAVR